MVCWKSWEKELFHGKPGSFGETKGFWINMKVILQCFYVGSNHLLDAFILSKPWLKKNSAAREHCKKNNLAKWVKNTGYTKKNGLMNGKIDPATHGPRWFFFLTHYVHLNLFGFELRLILILTNFNLFNNVHWPQNVCVLVWSRKILARVFYNIASTPFNGATFIS